MNIYFFNYYWCHHVDTEFVFFKKMNVLLLLNKRELPQVVYLWIESWGYRYPCSGSASHSVRSGGCRSGSETSRPIDLMQTSTHLFLFIEASKDIQPNREILAPPGVDTEQDKEQVLSIGKHPSLIKVIHKHHSAFKPECWCFWNIVETFSDDTVQIHHRKFYRSPSSVIFWIVVFLFIFVLGVPKTPRGCGQKETRERWSLMMISSSYCAVSAP